MKIYSYLSIIPLLISIPSCKPKWEEGVGSNLRVNIKNSSIIYRKSDDYIFQWPRSLMNKPSNDLDLFELTEEAKALNIRHVGELQDVQQNIERALHMSGFLLGKNWAYDLHKGYNHKFLLRKISIDLVGATHINARGIYSYGSDKDSVESEDSKDAGSKIAASLGVSFTTLSVRMHVQIENRQDIEGRVVRSPSATFTEFTLAKIEKEGKASAELSLS